MSRFEVAIQNLLEIGEKYRDPIDTPDIHDLTELCGLMAMTVEGAIAMNIDDTDIILEIVTGYLRLAYGLGRDRGKIEKEMEDFNASEV